MGRPGDGPSRSAGTPGATTTSCASARPWTSSALPDGCWPAWSGRRRPPASRRSTGGGRPGARRRRRRGAARGSSCWATRSIPRRSGPIDLPPPFLLVRGRCPARTGSPSPSWDRVGRRPTASGWPSGWAATSAARGVTVVSGLARGVDTAAHRGALGAGGRTVAVLGSGVDVVYPPENRRLAAEIAEAGAVVSQFPMGTAAAAAALPGAEPGHRGADARDRGRRGRRAERGAHHRALRGRAGPRGLRGARERLGRREARARTGSSRTAPSWCRGGRTSWPSGPRSGGGRSRPRARSPGATAAVGPGRGRGSSPCSGTTRSRWTRWWSGAGSRRARSRPGSRRSSCAGWSAGSAGRSTSCGA